jgi:hypothetical protein
MAPLQRRGPHATGRSRDRSARRKFEARQQRRDEAHTFGDVHGVLSSGQDLWPESAASDSDDGFQPGPEVQRALELYALRRDADPEDMEATLDAGRSSHGGLEVGSPTAAAAAAIRAATTTAVTAAAATMVAAPRAPRAPAAAVAVAAAAAATAATAGKMAVAATGAASAEANSGRRRGKSSGAARKHNKYSDQSRQLPPEY